MQYWLILVVVVGITIEHPLGSSGLHSISFPWTPLYVLGQPNFTSTNSNALLTGLDSPVAITIINNYLYVSDQGNNRTLQFYSQAPLQTPSAFDEISPDSMTAYKNRLLFSNQGTVLEKVIRSHSPIDSQTFQALVLDPNDHTSIVQHLAVDEPRNFMYISEVDKNRVVRYSISEISNNLTNPILYGQLDWNQIEPNQGGRSSIVKSNFLYHPHQVKVDCWGGVWIADSNNNRVVHYSLNSSIVDVIIGQPNGRVAVSSNMADGLESPNTVEMNEDCSVLWVTDTNNYRVMAYDHPYSTGMNASGVLGAANVNESGVDQADESSFVHLSGLVYDSKTGILWVVDRGGNRVVGGGVKAQNQYIAGDVHLMSNRTLTVQNRTQIIITGDVTLSNTSSVVLGTNQTIQVLGSIVFAGVLHITVSSSQIIVTNGSSYNSNNTGAILIQVIIYSNYSGEFSSILVQIEDDNGDSGCFTQGTGVYSDHSLSVVFNPSGGTCKGSEGGSNKQAMIVIVVCVVVGTLLIAVIVIVSLLILFAVLSYRRATADVGMVNV